MKRIITLLATLLMAAMLFGCGASDQPEGQQQANEPENKDLILATTTSTQDSGLLDVLEPLFEEQTGYNLKIIAVGTGKALSMGEEGEADVLLTHAPASEKELVDSGFGINYQLVMHNDFIIVGPADDPAGINGLESAGEALGKISETNSGFISRGDDSGTHKKELSIWEDAGVEHDGDWYQETGSGMADTLIVADQKQAYCITDRATYLAHKDNMELDILVEGDGVLLNIYHVMQVNPDKHDKINADGAKAFVEFMISDEVQKIIAEFGKEKFGQPLFFPDADKKLEDLMS